MPEDLWTYKWVFLRGILALPLLMISNVAGLFSNRFKMLNIWLTDKFIPWDYE